MSPSIDRRTFLATGAAGVMGARSLLDAQSTSSHVIGANDRVRIGVREIGHRSSSAAILGNLSYRSGAPVAWDAAAERITGNDRAAALLNRGTGSPGR